MGAPERSGCRHVADIESRLPAKPLLIVAQAAHAAPAAGLAVVAGTGSRHLVRPRTPAPAGSPAIRAVVASRAPGGHYFHTRTPTSPRRPPRRVEPVRPRRRCSAAATDR
ncbi:hypothetical protein GCM10010429_17360 [Micromonospora olivasterospora]